MTAATCCFTGHRPQHLGIKSGSEAHAALMGWIISTVRDMAEKRGVSRFISGMAMGSDIYFAEAVLKLREVQPGVILECALPFKGQADRWANAYKVRYQAILSQANIISSVQLFYDEGCYERRNRYMVDNADYVAAIWNGNPGGTANTIKYAEKKGRAIYIWNPVKMEQTEILPPIKMF